MESIDRLFAHQHSVQPALSQALLMIQLDGGVGLDDALPDHRRVILVLPGK